MDEQTKFVFISKIEDVKRVYDEKYSQATERLEFFSRQCQMFERLCDDGNVLIKLEDMNAKEMTRKLSIVEKDPSVVWDALESSFGFGYFNSIIEKEFGITPEFKEFIHNQFNDELNKTRTEMHSKIKKIGRSMKNEMETFRNLINRKNLEVSKLISDQLA